MSSTGGSSAVRTGTVGGAEVLRETGVWLSTCGNDRERREEDIFGIVGMEHFRPLPHRSLMVRRIEGRLVVAGVAKDGLLKC
jgi:hypothetical protein